MSILTGTLTLNKESFVLAPEVELTNEASYATEYGNMKAFAEAYEDMAAIVGAAAEYDIQELSMVHEAQEQGVTVESLIPVYESAIADKAKAFFAKIKKMIQDLWAKVKKFFANAIMAVSAMFMNGKKFVSKYKTKLEAVKSKKVTLDGFVFTNIEAIDGATKVSKDKLDKLIKDFTDVGTHIKAYSKDVTDYNKSKEDKIKVDEMLQTLKDNKEEFLNGVRSNLIGKTNQESYSQDLYRYFRNNETAAKQITMVVSDAIKILESDYSGVVKNIQKEFDRSFNDQLKKVNDFEKDIKAIDNMDERTTGGQVISKYMSAASAFNSEATGIKSIISSFFTAWKSAISAAESQAKKVCVKAATGKADE